MLFRNGQDVFFFVVKVTLRLSRALTYKKINAILNMFKSHSIIGGYHD
jgi:hypothetical protein